MTHTEAIDKLSDLIANAVPLAHALIHVSAVIGDDRQGEDPAQADSDVAQVIQLRDMACRLAQLDKALGMVAEEYAARAARTRIAIGARKDAAIKAAKLN